MSLRLIERNFSERESCASVMLVNMHAAADVGKNISLIEEVIEVAHRKGANIVIFPELCVTGYVWDDPDDPDDTKVRGLLDEGENSRIAASINGIRDSLRDDGQGLEYVFYNNVRRIRGEDKLRNSTFVLHHGFDYTREEYIYDKVFLTPIERRFFQQGTDKRLTIDTKWGRFGFLTCYDLCFVELARKYALHDHVDAMVAMAHWRSEAVREYPQMNIMTDHYYGYLWDLMNASKAAYNQLWSLASNAVGPHDVTGNYFWGGSGIWAPSGMPVVQSSNITPELILVHNLDIRRQRFKERDDFDYYIDFSNFYKEISDSGSETQKMP